MFLGCEVNSKSMKGLDVVVGGSVAGSKQISSGIFLTLLKFPSSLCQ